MRVIDKGYSDDRTKRLERHRTKSTIMKKAIGEPKECI